MAIPSPRPRFLADCNVGRLARWLRALGYDAAFVHSCPKAGGTPPLAASRRTPSLTSPTLSDGFLVWRARNEGRVLLTRDVELTHRRLITTGEVRIVLLQDDDVQLQLRQVVRELDLDGEAALSRCLECNVALEPRSLAAVEDRLPPYVRASQDRFAACPRCGRVYWPGTHWQRMQERLAAL
jgi:uncharacterized protein with PIN domain